MILGGGEFDRYVDDPKFPGFWRDLATNLLIFPFDQQDLPYRLKILGVETLRKTWRRRITGHIIVTEENAIDYLSGRSFQIIRQPGGNRRKAPKGIIIEDNRWDEPQDID